MNSMKSKLKPIPQLKRDADKAFSKYVRYRDSYIQNGERVADCITCGRTYPVTQLQCGHFVSRRVDALRYDERNCNIQCSGCNVFKYGEQYLYGLRLDQKYGVGTAQALYDRRYETRKFTRAELIDIIFDSNIKLKEAEVEK